jgi:hypothetical protein
MLITFWMDTRSVCKAVETYEYKGGIKEYPKEIVCEDLE